MQPRSLQRLKHSIQDIIYLQFACLMLLLSELDKTNNTLLVLFFLLTEDIVSWYSSRRWEEGISVKIYKFWLGQLFIIYLTVFIFKMATVLITVPWSAPASRCKEEYSLLYLCTCHGGEFNATDFGCKIHSIHYWTFSTPRMCNCYDFFWERIPSFFNYPRRINSMHKLHLCYRIMHNDQPSV